MSDKRFDRQVIAFGDEGQQRIASAVVGIIGLGGLGSHVVQGLAYLGVRDFTLVDDDRVEETNLNRLIGAFPHDVAEHRLKVEVATRMISQIAPNAKVHAIGKNLCSSDALESLIKCDVIFGCVDQDAPRLILSELATAFNIVYIDLATEIICSDGMVSDIGGRVVVSQPGLFCLLCAKEIDLEAAKFQLLSKDTQNVSQDHGYGLGIQVPSPSVVSLNGVIANLAITEFLAHETGFKPVVQHLTYYALRNRVVERKDPKNPSCYNCSLVGKREAANTLRYVA